MPAEEMGILSRLGLWLAVTLAAGMVLLGLAGRLDLPMLWAYLAVASGWSLAAALLLPPGEIRERHRPGPGDVGGATTALLRAASAGHIVVGALDAGRLHWSDTVPPGARAAALALMAACLGLALWAIAVNRFFTHQVRVQTERGHRVVTAGPYRYVRHPAYVALLVGMPSSALALGSWAALAAATAGAIVLLWRTALEDRHLSRHLDGYADYAREVRYRLVPGLW